VIKLAQGKQVILRSPYGEIKGFDFNMHHKTFSMNLQDMKANFPQVVVTKVHKEYHYSACPITLLYQGAPGDAVDTTTFISMRVEKDTNIYLQVSQKDPRMFLGGKNQFNYKTSYSRLLVLALDDDDRIVRYLGGSCGGNL